MIFNIQRYSTHDGPGIRTVVFLKGCSLGVMIHISGLIQLLRVNMLISGLKNVM